MPLVTDDLRISAVKEVISPATLLTELPLSDRASRTVAGARFAIHEILSHVDDRLLVITGPCSIHDPDAAHDYAERLKALTNEVQQELLVVMRVYFEKPRTTIGWKGLINDPGLDGSFRINDGLRIARRLLLDLNEMGIPAATEYLDPISPQYVSDLIAWGAIGARTTESQVHRELASGLSCPIGFKNATDGGLQIALDAIISARHPHHFLGVTKEGQSAIFSTAGNPDGHLILRGGGAKPNYDSASIAAAAALLAKAGIDPAIVVDCSHANSQKLPQRQIAVCENIGEQLADGDNRIVGVMLESNIVAGRQDLVEGQPLRYGQSITDACIAWEDTADLLHVLANAVQARRRAAHLRRVGE